MPPRYLASGSSDWKVQYYSRPQLEKGLLSLAAPQEALDVVGGGVFWHHAT